MNFPPRVSEVLERLQRSRWKYFNLHPTSAAVLALLARLSHARRVVEVGTSNGYSAIVLGTIVREHGGQVVTIERDGRLAEEAKEHISEAGLQDVVTVVPGSAFKVLRDLPGPWDFAFLDATKQEYVGYLDRLLPKLSPQALLVADNVLSHADELRPFTERVLSDQGIDATVLPVGTGLLIGVFEGKRAPASEAVERTVMSLTRRLAAVAPNPTRAARARR